MEHRRACGGCLCPSRRALAAQPKLFFADAGIAMALRTSGAARATPEALGASREGIVYQHLRAWCDVTRDASLSTWRTTGGVEVDFVVESSEGLTAIEVKSGTSLRPADRRGLLAFHDEFPDARLIALTDTALLRREGPIETRPLADYLAAIVPGDSLP
jgi:predicted AAA+ superfamily ATPase